jgi:hypothetical protein
VTFRSLATGQLLTHLKLPQLSATTAHPIVQGFAEGVPISYDGRFLAVTDGLDYILVDTQLMRVRWQKRIEAVDRWTSGPLPYRLWLLGEHVFALKRSFDTQVCEMIDRDSGRGLWAKSEEKNEGVIYSAAADDRNVYGLHYQPKVKSLHLLGYDRATGNRVLDVQTLGFGDAEMTLDPCVRGRCIVAVVKKKQEYMLLLLDKQTGREVGRIQVKGYGLFGNYGEVSYSIQGSCAAVLSGNALHAVLSAK